MTTICAVLADGFEEIEAITVIDVLRRASLEVSVVGVKSREVKGSHGIVVAADALLDAALDKPWDAVFLPGGLPGAYHLRDEPSVQRFLREQAARGAVLAAICAAPIALAQAGLLQGRRVTSYPSFKDALSGAAVYEEGRVVEDGAVITSRGPGTAFELALHLVARFCSADTARALAQSMLVSPAGSASP